MYRPYLRTAPVRDENYGMTIKMLFGRNGADDPQIGAREVYVFLLDGGRTNSHNDLPTAFVKKDQSNPVRLQKTYVSLCGCFISV